MPFDDPPFPSLLGEPETAPGGGGGENPDGKNCGLGRRPLRRPEVVEETPAPSGSPQHAARARNPRLRSPARRIAGGGPTLTLASITLIFPAILLSSNLSSKPESNLWIADSPRPAPVFGESHKNTSGH